ncbi:hypothetical protein J2Y03_000662 [Neobacillus niacini]|nr:hypothetical protein [Neobacillus niacini]
MFAKEGQQLDVFVEVTIKDDDREDPPINQDAFDMLGILSKDEYIVLKELTQQNRNIVKEELAKKDI